MLQKNSICLRCSYNEHCMFRYLKVEIDDPIYGQRYKDVFVQMKNKLSIIPFKLKDLSTQQGQGNFTPLSSVLDSVSKIGSGHSKMTPKSYRTMWNVLETQSDFISDVVECQLESRLARGRKEMKEKYLKDTLQKKGCHKLDNGAAVLLPSAPNIWVTGVKPQTARMFKSALYPALIEFYVDKESSFKIAGDELKSTYKVMVKTGDDLRQDQLVIMMIKLMDRILKRGTLDLCLKPYPILAMSDKTGLVEFVPNSMAISQVLAENNNSILNYFQKVAPSKDGKYGVDPEVMQTYIRSCAGYCVITYIIGVGDRHLDVSKSSQNMPRVLNINCTLNQTQLRLFQIELKEYHDTKKWTLFSYRFRFYFWTRSKAATTSF